MMIFEKFYGLNRIKLHTQTHQIAQFKKIFLGGIPPNPPSKAYGFATCKFPNLKKNILGPPPSQILATPLMISTICDKKGFPQECIVRGEGQPQKFPPPSPPCIYRTIRSKKNPHTKKITLTYKIKIAYMEKLPPIEFFYSCPPPPTRRAPTLASLT